MAMHTRKANRKVSRVPREFRHGELGGAASGKSVKRRKQAIAIALSEAEKAEGWVPRRRAA